MRELLPSYLTESERVLLSLARHSGGLTINGHRYTYFAESDELWRDDVLALVHGWRKAAKKAAEPGVQWEQPSLLGGEG